MINKILISAKERNYRESVRNKIEVFVTNVQFLLQATLNRKLGTNLNQLRTKDIQKNLKHSIEDYLEGIKEIASQEITFFYEYFSEVSLELRSAINEEVWQIIMAVMDYNLAHDFESHIVFYLQNLELQQLDTVLKLLILCHVKQCLERRLNTYDKGNAKAPYSHLPLKMDFYNSRL